MNLFGFLRRSRVPTAGAATRGEGPGDPLKGPESAELAHPHPAAAPQHFLSPPPPTPEQIRRLLFDAVASRDEPRLHALCKEHEELIVQNSAAWLEVPPEFRRSPELNEWYGNGLRAISQFCTERLAQYELTEAISRVLEGRRT